jgi:hypothetical protein
MRRGLALVMMCGCSFAFVHGPKPAPAAPDCTQSRVVPILDSVLTGVAALVAIYAIAASSSEWHDANCDANDSSCTAPDQAVFAVAGSVVALAGGAGMYWGYTRVGECRRAQGEAPFVGDRPLPVVTPPPPPPPPADAGEGSGDAPPIPPTGLPVPGAN